MTKQKDKMQIITKDENSETINLRKQWNEQIHMNNSLRTDLNELSAKTKTLQEERDSLLTVLRLVTEDAANGPTESSSTDG